LFAAANPCAIPRLSAFILHEVIFVDILGKDATLIPAAFN